MQFVLYIYIYIYIYIYKSSARSITVSNTTCYCNLTFMLLVFIYICSLEWFIISRSIQFMYLMNCFRFLLVSSLLLTGHLPTLSTLLFRISLSFFSLLHWNIRWSAVCMPCWQQGINLFSAQQKMIELCGMSFRTNAIGVFKHMCALSMH